MQKAAESKTGFSDWRILTARKRVRKIQQIIEAISYATI